MAATGQVAAVEMDFRVPDRVLTPPEPVVEDEETPDDRTLLSTPFPSTDLKPADPLAAIRQVPDRNKIVSTIGLQHLRALATASTEIRTRAESVRTASAAVENRLDLQVAEYARQLKLLRDSSEIIQTIVSDTKSNAEKIESMSEAQAALVERLDAVLNAMLAEYRPQIGEVERKWFDELERVRQTVSGGRRAPGLAHRAKVLKERLEVVRSQAKTAESNGAAAEEYGRRQLRPLQAALGARSDELARMLRKMESLSVKVEDGVVEE